MNARPTAAELLDTLADALRPLIAEVVREELELARLTSSDHPWLSVEETAQLLRTSPGAIRQRISTGWLAGDTVRDGKRRFVRREAVLHELEQKARRRSE